MRKITLFILSTLVVFGSERAFAGSDWSPYVSAKVDASKLYASNNILEEPFNVGFGGAVGMQYQLTANFALRGELELSLHSFSSDKKFDDSPHLYIKDSYDYKQTTVLANFYIERDRGWKLKPYGMVGLGMANFKETITKSTYVFLTDTTTYTENNDKGNAFAFAFGAGFAFDILDNLKGDIGVRYMITSPVTILSPTAGIRYTF
ncbi:MAG: outer membrane beta-barrel protein [Alphaproteobacteria bacterium]|nr:outer membrane beta-barrel protein [Alphaproteobacteria bacterium]